MISFWVDAGGRFGITNYLADRGAPLKERFTIQPYEGLRPRFDIRGGAQVFSALDQLTPAGREAVAAILDQLATAQPGVPLLNDPRRTLLREALLTRLAEAGINRFRVWRGDAADAVDRFPVFVREASGHSGNQSQLLESPAELRRALRSLRVRGHRPADLLIVEYCHTADAEGRYRKYAAFKVGDTILPTHLLVGRQWMVKSAGDIRTLDMAQEERVYVTENPHATWLERVFALAGVGYGRIDYGVHEGVPQVWEINLNPTIGRPPGAPRRPLEPEVAEVRDATRSFFHARLREAFAALEPRESPEAVPVTLAPALVARIAREAARERQHVAMVNLVSAVYGHLPLRNVVGRLFPRR